VIEKARRRERSIHAELRTDQDRIGRDTNSLKKGGKKSVLVFAIAVSIGKDVRGGMRSVTAESEVDPDVAVAGGDKIIEGVKFLVIRGLPFSDIVGFGANFRGNCGLGPRQITEPLADFLSRRKR